MATARTLQSKVYVVFFLFTVLSSVLFAYRMNIWQRTSTIVERGSIALLGSRTVSYSHPQKTQMATKQVHPPAADAAAAAVPHHGDYSLVADNVAIERSLLDNRSYRFIKLNKNNLHVLLIHDPTTDKSAASLDVNVGSITDGKYKIPGLAHFCEHLLFMGTKKFPQENEYSSYLSKHSGHSNAYTAAEHTNYYFEVDSKFLKGALDRFGQFFIEPLFSKSCKDREIKAVDSENKKNLQNDLWRSYQLDKSLSNANHPYNGFSTGNFQTLHEEPISRGVDVRDTLIKFHSEHYSSNIMSLVVLGKENLDELAAWAEEIFSSVPNQNLSRPNYGDVNAYTSKDLRKLIKLKSVLDHKKLEVSFKIPSDHEQDWDCKPGQYYSHLLGHEGKGSILYYLKQQKGWCNELGAGQQTVCQGLSQFDVNIDLTEEGLNHWEEVVVSIFQYLELVSASPPQKWIFDEIAKMSAINFKFQQKKGAASTVSQISKKLIKYQEDGIIPSNYILSSSILREFNEQKIKEYGDYLTSGENFRITLASQTFEGLNERERWYGTEYSYTEIPASLDNALKHLKPNENFHFPIPNDFIPENFTIFNKVKQTSETCLKHPYLVEDNTKFQVWYKQDDQFEVPKGTVESVLHLPNSNVSCKTSVLSTIWAELIDDELNEIAYYASIVGLSFHISPWRDGIVIKVSGYNDKLKVLVEKVISKVASFQPKRDRFTIIKHKLLQDYKNFGYGVPYQQIGTHFLTLINDKTYTDKERIEVLKNDKEISFEALEAFIKSSQNEAQSEGVWSGGIFGEILVQGNFRLEDCKEIYSIYDKTFKDVKQVSDSIESINSVVKVQNYVIENGSRFKYEILLDDPKNINSCIEYYIQIADIKPENDKLRVLTDLLCTIIHEPCFGQLRTKEQLGYVVFSGLRLARTNFGVRFLIQSERTTDYLEYRIEEFISKFGKYVASELTEENFENFKQALKDKKLTKLKNLNEEVGRFWNGIIDGFYDFEVKPRHVKILEGVSLKEFQQFFSEYIQQENKTGRIVVHLKAQTPPVQPKKKLIHSSLINYLYRNGLYLGSDTLEEILDEAIEGDDDKSSSDVDLGKLSTKITNALVAYVPSEQDEDAKRNDISNATAFAASLEKTIAAELVAPVPAKYPSGKVINSISEFRAKESKKGGIPLPVAPLKNFYIPSNQAHL